jgi:L-threonylcarbamoyladenylate synthase
MEKSHTVATDSELKEAIRIIKDGGIVIYPTDTAFGIGCRMDDRLAVDRLFSLRNRSRTHAVPVLVVSVVMALAYLDHPFPIVRRLMDTHWPGALTIVAACKKDKVYSPIRGGQNTVGVRMPDHDVPASIIEAIGVPILGPSANFHGLPTPYSFETIDPKLKQLVDFCLPGECPIGMVSTVVDCSQEPFRVIRKGAVTV